MLTCAQAGFVTLCSLTLVSLSNGYGDSVPKPEYNVSEAVRVSVIS